MADFLNIDALAEKIADKVRAYGILAPRLMTIEQAAAYLGLTKDALRAKARRGKLPSVMIDANYRFDRQDLDRIIEENKR